jgi:uncharacterized membrane protein YesL
MNGMADGIYKLSEWFMRFAYINILFILFSVIGLVIFGVGPAFVAMLTVIKKWYSKEEFPVFKTYMNVFKSEFVQGNKLGVSCIAIGTILFVNFGIIQQFEPILRLMLTSAMVMLVVLYLMTFIYLFPLRVKQKLPIGKCIKYGFIVGVTHPLYFFIWVVGMAIIYQTFRVIPGLIPFYGFSVGAVWLFFVTRLVLTKVNIT